VLDHIFTCSKISPGAAGVTAVYLYIYCLENVTGEAVRV
jgi:hypothetical protein